MLMNVHEIHISRNENYEINSHLVYKTINFHLDFYLFIYLIYVKLEQTTAMHTLKQPLLDSISPFFKKKFSHYLPPSVILPSPPF